MKKLLCVLGIAAMCLAGCGDDNGGGNNNGGNNNGGNGGNNNGNNNGGNGNGGEDTIVSLYSSVCGAMYKDEWDFSSLDADKQSQLESAFMDPCIDAYSKVPACKVQFLEYYNCIMVDTPASVWDELDEKEEKCREDHVDDEEALYACIDAVYANKPCKSHESAMTTCYYEPNTGKIFEDYWKDIDISEDVVALLESWNLKPSDFDREGAISVELDYGGLCEAIFEGSWDFSSLDADKKSQLAVAWKEACITDFLSAPSCDEENFNYYYCQYVTMTPSERYDYDFEEDQCSVEYSDEADIDACIEDVYADHPCKAVDAVFAACMGPEWGSYEPHAYSVVENMMENWGLDLNDYEYKFY